MMDDIVVADLSNLVQGLLKVNLGNFKDKRGENVELYDSAKFKEFFPKVSTVSLSRSKKNVLRGFHGDLDNWKAVKPNVGVIQLFAFDARKDSPTYEKWAKFDLSATENCWIVIPPGVVNAHLAMTDCEFLYLLSEGYSPPENQIHIKWDAYDFPWFTRQVILSDRDK